MHDRASRSNQEEIAPSPGAAGLPRVLPMFSTPLHVFLGVMGPICALMVAVALLRGFPAWARISALVVVAVSLDAFRRGYLHRVVVHADHVVYRTLRWRIEIPWEQVRLMGRYVPPDRNRTTGYVFITRRDHAPVSRHEIDADTLQLQDRPGLLEWLEETRGQAIRGANP